MGEGFLAIWSDIDPASETDYLHWFSREHSIERVSIPGFLAVRMFRALDVDVRRYLILYELQNANVVGSSGYLAKLNQPTPWSQRIMPQLQNFMRGGGYIVAHSGIGQGSFVAALQLNSAEPVASGMAAAIAKCDRIASARVLTTDRAQTEIRTREKGLRNNDRSFEALVVIEGLDMPSVRAALDVGLAQISQAQLVDPSDRTIYSMVFSLDRRLIGEKSADSLPL